MATLKSPVFILGVPRSGTSALQLALIGQCGYQGFGEGHLLPVLQSLLNAVDTYWYNSAAADVEGTMLNEVGHEQLREEARASMRSLYTSTFGNSAFTDKTPGIDAIRMAVELPKIWEDVRIIYCQRRGIENVVSKLRKFAEHSFKNHCSEWATTVLEWRRVRDALPHYLELDQIEMALAPRATAARIGGYLDLKRTQIDALGAALATIEVERTSDRALDQIPALWDVGWPHSRCAKFSNICGEAMVACGYAYDESYWTRPLPSEQHEVKPESS